MRLKKEILSLECILTDSEKLKYSKSLAENICALQRKEDDLKAFSAQAKAEISGHQASVNLLSEKINRGREYRSVECSITYDFEAKEKSWIRSDTGEIARTDIITESELQEEASL